MAGLFFTYNSLCVCTGRYNDTIITDGWDGYVSDREKVTHMRACAHTHTHTHTLTLTTLTHPLTLIR